MGFLGAVLLYIVVETVALVAVAHRIGVLDAIALLIIISLCGPWLVRRAGFAVWRRAATHLAAGETPAADVVDGVVLLAAGLLICIPGYVTDLAGVILLLPPVRALMRRRMLAGPTPSMVWRVGVGAAGRFGGGEVVDAGSHDPASPGPGRGHGGADDAGGGETPAIDAGSHDSRRGGSGEASR